MKHLQFFINFIFVLNITFLLHSTGDRGIPENDEYIKAYILHKHINATHLIIDSISIIKIFNSPFYTNKYNCISDISNVYNDEYQNAVLYLNFFNFIYKHSYEFLNSTIILPVNWFYDFLPFLHSICVSCIL